MLNAHLGNPASSLGRLTEWAEEQWDNFSLTQAPHEASAAQLGINMAKIRSITPEAMYDIKETVERMPFTRKPGGGLTEAGEIFVIGILGSWLKGQGVEIEDSDVDGLKALIKENEGKIAPAPDTGAEQTSKRLVTQPAAAPANGANLWPAATALGLSLLMIMANPTGALNGFALQTAKGPDA